MRKTDHRRVDHARRGPTRARGVAAALGLATLLLAGSTVRPARADDPDNCLLCHQFRGLGRIDNDTDELHLFHVDPEYVRTQAGPHARIACTGCHERSEVSVIPHQPVSKVNCTRECHLNDPSGLARRFSHQDLVGMLKHSIHSPDKLAKLEFTGGPLLQPGQSQCLYCHDEPVFRKLSDLIPLTGATGEISDARCEVCHAGQIPLSTDYYLKHVASRVHHARTPIELAQVCAVCHSDPKVRRAFDLPDADVGYSNSFHGKAALLGAFHTADCISCHVKYGENAHLIRSRKNPLSATHPDNKANSCRATACHPGADKAIAAAAVHFDIPELGRIEIGLAIFFVVLTMLTFGPSLVLTVLELMQVVIGRHVHGEERMKRLTLEILKHPEGRRRLRRFTPAQNVQHWLLAFLFATLVATGFPMKFASQHWARLVINAMGGLGVARLIHHLAGAALVAGFLIHLLFVVGMALRRSRQRLPDGRRVGIIRAVMSLPLFIGPEDLKKAGQLLAYLLFLRKDPPTFGRFTIDQKFEYVGVGWGTFLLGATGALLWGQQIATHYFSGRVFNIAVIAHTYEAFLAVIHVGILHICNVVFSPMVFPISRATLTGQTPIVRLAESHTEFVERVARELGIEVPAEAQHD